MAYDGIYVAPAQADEQRMYYSNLVAGGNDCWMMIMMWITARMW